MKAETLENNIMVVPMFYVIRHLFSVKKLKVILGHTNHIYFPMFLYNIKKDE